ncbi:MAG: amidohydrolase family protein [Acidobacteria bacterium]|nr:amidohydrolase family protein [Acidobacteriota bacterium]
MIALLSLAASAFAQTTAFVNATVIPMDRERVLKNHTVVVRDGRIADVGPSSKIKLPAHTTRIDAKGKFLIPGIAEMHAHVPPQQAAEEQTRNTLLLYVLNGVTTARGMLGAPHHPQLRERVAKGEILGPTLYIASPAFGGSTVKTPGEARRLVPQYKQAGFDLLKIQEGLSPAAYDAVVAAAKEQGIRFGGHVPDAVGLEHALRSGQGAIDHLDNYIDALEADNSPVRSADNATRARELIDHIDEKKLPALVKATLDAKAWVVPTLTVWRVLICAENLEELKARPELKYVPKATIDQWAAQITKRSEQLNNADANRRHAALRDRILLALSKAGVGVLLGSDAPQTFQVPGFSLLRELEYMQRAGLRPYEVLAAGTHNPAIYFDAESEFGTITAGRRADLILLDANPLENVSNVRRQAGVMARGRWLPASEIRQMMARLEAK